MPASNSTETSGVSINVHMERTPKLSAANGVTLIFPRTRVMFLPEFLCLSLCKNVSSALLLLDSHNHLCLKPQA
jgi:hypothetical protein